MLKKVGYTCLDLTNTTRAFLNPLTYLERLQNRILFFAWGHVIVVFRICGSLSLCLLSLPLSLTLKEMLRPIPVALASCTRYFEAMSAMRESLATLQHLRVGLPSLPVTPAKDNSQGINDLECVTPPPWREDPSSNDLVLRRQEMESQREDSEVGDSCQIENLNQR